MHDFSLKILAIMVISLNQTCKAIGQSKVKRHAITMHILGVFKPSLKHLQDSCDIMLHHAVSQFYHFWDGVHED